jgi:hypothetical protein
MYIHKINNFNKIMPKKCFSLIKYKAVPQHTHGGARGERRYSSYSFTTSALDGVSG